MDKNINMIDSTLKLLDKVSSKTYKPVIDIADRAKSKIVMIQKDLMTLDKKLFSPVIEIAEKSKNKVKNIHGQLEKMGDKSFKATIEIADKARTKIEGVQNGLKYFDKKILAPMIKITGGENSKLKVIQDGLNKIDKMVLKPAIDVIDKTKEKIKNIHNKFNQINDSVFKPIISVIDNTKNGVNFINKNLKQFSNKVLKPSVEVIDKTKGTLKNIKDGFGSISSTGLNAFGKIKGAVSSFNVSMAMTKARTAAAAVGQWALNIAMSASPITWIIVGVVALIGVIMLLVKHWDTVKAAIGKFWNFVVSIFSNIGSWFKKHVIEPILNLMPGWLKKLLGIGGSVDVNVSAKGKVDGNHANGLSYVPFDGYVAELHKGERVLTSSENKSYRNTNKTSNNAVSKGGNTFNITINGVSKSTNEIINEIVAKIKETAGTMGEVAYSR